MIEIRDESQRYDTQIHNNQWGNAPTKSHKCNREIFGKVEEKNKILEWES